MLLTLATHSGEDKRIWTKGSASFSLLPAFFSPPSAEILSEQQKLQPIYSDMMLIIACHERDSRNYHFVRKTYL